ncbi:MAG: BrnT family toxin [Bryobacteraceae bacterium]
MTFEWYASKAVTNLWKHRVAFEDAATVFLDPLAMTFPDPDHSLEERREITIGCTIRGLVVFVSHCERGERVRIIGARHATRTERKQYEEGVSNEAR